MCVCIYIYIYIWMTDFFVEKHMGKTICVWICTESKNKNKPIKICFQMRPKALKFYYEHKIQKLGMSIHDVGVSFAPLVESTTLW